jgi:hypothetical protein
MLRLPRALPVALGDGNFDGDLVQREFSFLLRGQFQRRRGRTIATN